MKNNIMRIMTFALIFLFSQSLIAQDRGQEGSGQRQSREERQKAQRTQLIKDLKLTKDQIVKYDAANKKYTEALTKMRESGDREGMREKMQEETKKRDAEYKKIFDKSQLEKYTKLQEERNKNRQGRGRVREIR
ncbi:hypothetical protein ACFLSI_05925 [Bacteroidota bacterium]